MLQKKKLIILDLDGVLANTRQLHFEAWKEVIDKFLFKTGLKLLTEKEYEEYIDGKIREEGLNHFLESRKIHIGLNQSHLLSERKRKSYLHLLKIKGPEVFHDTIKSLENWKRAGIPLALVSSSRHADIVLKILKISNYFKVKIDGTKARDLHLNGKPSADIFLQAAKEAGVKPEDSVVIEDSLAGVKAAREGRFGLVIGLQRIGQTAKNELLAAGANYVVDSLSNIKLDP